MAGKKETRQFEAEVQQLLKLIINSLYSNQEIFLRELLSNASDALDKLHFNAQTDADLLGDDGELKIKIIPDGVARTLTVTDNGIGIQCHARIPEWSEVRIHREDEPDEFVDGVVVHCTETIGGYKIGVRVEPR